MTWKSITGALLALLVTTVVGAQTPMPTPFQTVLDNSGLIVNGACVWTYQAGTTTSATTYTTQSLSVPNSNPIQADSAGRFTAFLAVGTSYKFVYETACTPPAHGSVLRTADNILSVPGSGSAVDVVGTAGETLAAGNVVYVSDGSGGKVAGDWYKADSSNTYSSTTPIIGMVMTTISATNTGSVRVSGSVTGLGAVTQGALYYVGTTGAVTSTAPVNTRLVGQADTTTSLIVAPNPPVPRFVDNSASRGRLTLTTGVPVTTGDVTAATKVYYTPFRGNTIALYNGTTWQTVTFTELSLNVPATTATMYDVWGYLSSGALALDTSSWSSDSARTTSLALQDGVLTKNGDATRRWLGSFRTTGVSGQTEDSQLHRYLFNATNRVQRTLRVVESTSTWSYSTATWRQANNSSANQVDAVIGWTDTSMRFDLLVEGNTSGGTFGYVAIGADSVTVPTAGQLQTFIATGTDQSGGYQIWGTGQASLQQAPTVGRHYWAWLEKASAASVAFAGTDGGTAQSGLVGWYEG